MVCIVFSFSSLYPPSYAGQLKRRSIQMKINEIGIWQVHMHFGDDENEMEKISQLTKVKEDQLISLNSKKILT